MAIHVVHFYGPITLASVETLRDVCLQAVHQGGASEIQLRVSSDGGQLSPGFTAYHFLRSLTVPLVTCNIGNVESIAVLIYLAGNTRVCVPHGRFKLHALHWGFGAGPVDHDRLAEYTESLNFDAARYAAIFRERTAGASQAVDVSANLAGRALILSSQQALAAGMATSVDEVMTPADAIHWWPAVVKA